MQLIPDVDERALIQMVGRQAETAFGQPDDTHGGVDVRNAASALAEFGWLEIGAAESDGGLDLLGWAFVVRETERWLGPVTILPTLVAFAAAHDIGWNELSSEIEQGIGNCAWLTHSASGRHLAFGDGGGVQSGLRIGPSEVELLRVSCQDSASESLEGSAGTRVVDVLEARQLKGEDARRTLSRLWILQAAAGAGLCEETTRRSTQYAKLREQFGRSIGSFQSVAHRCADMQVRAEVLWRQTCLAALSFSAGLPSAHVEAASARILAARYAVQNAASNVQNHGGVGFTMELPEHRYVRRARQLAHLGSEAQAAQAIAGALAESEN